MLTKTDLSEIRKIVREEVENEAQAMKDVSVKKKIGIFALKRNY